MSSRHLIGMHDWSGDWARIVQAERKTAWCVTTHDVQNERSFDFGVMASYGVTPMARLNWGYGSTGAIPEPGRYPEFAERCANFVRNSAGCRLWIVGNEPNHPQEWPGGQPITPDQYVACYRLVHAAIKRVAPDAAVMPAPVALWTDQVGVDWITYFRHVLNSLGPNLCDGIPIHTYSRGADPTAIRSDAKMGAPYSQYHSGFRSYRDLLNAVPSNMRHLPVYITETDQNEPWCDRNTGWVQAACAEIQAWNSQPHTQKIYSLVLFRWPAFDAKWHIEGKQGVIQDFCAALRTGCAVPEPSSAGSAPKHTVHIPIIAGGGSPKPAPQPAPGPGSALNPPPRAWDARLDRRGVKVQERAVSPGTAFWDVVKVQWFDEDEADRVGPDHHILVDVLDAAGKRMVGVPVKVSWPDGETIIVTQDKPNQIWAADYGMSPSRNEFSVEVADGSPSDKVTGIGMGKEVPGGFNAGIHTSTLVVFQRRQAPEVQAPEPEPVQQPQPNTGQSIVAQWIGRVTASVLNVRMGPGTSFPVVDELRLNDPVPVYETVTRDGVGWYRIGKDRWVVSAYVIPEGPQTSRVPSLVHPVSDPRYRTVTQLFGVNGDYYQRFVVDGVPLRGHNGVDFGTPTGTLIAAVDDGTAVEVAHDPSGYGKYVKLQHAWGESLYAHLDEQRVQVGDAVRAGQHVGCSGNTGNSTGPHLHFGLRVKPFNRADGWGGYSDPLPYLVAATGEPNRIWPILQAAAKEFGVDKYLLASLVYAESSWRPDATSSAGAQGLGQIMPATWNEWASQVGAANPFDAKDNARVSAAYLAWLLKATGSERAALYAYNWGIGNVLAGKTPPAETLEYANKIMHGADLLRVVAAGGRA